MVISSLYRIETGDIKNHPSNPTTKTLYLLFGNLVYCYLFQFSIPQFASPIRDKNNICTHLFATIFINFVGLSSVSLTAMYAFDEVKPHLSLNFRIPSCLGYIPRPSDVINDKFTQYFSGLIYPLVIGCSSSPVTGVLLRNILLESVRGPKPMNWFVEYFLVPSAVPIFPLIISLLVRDIGPIVIIGGLVPGVFIQYIIPAVFLFLARKRVRDEFGFDVNHQHRSPFGHQLFLVLMLMWAIAAVVVGIYLLSAEQDGKVINFNSLWKRINDVISYREWLSSGQGQPSPTKVPHHRFVFVTISVICVLNCFTDDTVMNYLRSCI